MTAVNWMPAQAALFVTSSPQRFFAFGLLVQREYEFIVRRENQVFTECHLTVYNKTESKTREKAHLTLQCLSGMVCWILV